MDKTQCVNKLRQAITALTEAQEFFADKPKIYAESEEARFFLEDLADQLGG